MNTTITVPKELGDLDKLIYLVRISDKADALTCEGLYRVFESKSYEGRFSSWGEFVSSPEGLGKSESWASKRKSIYEEYVVLGKLSPAKLLGVPIESLYIACELPGTAEDKLAAAKTLTRQELRLSKNDAEEKPHEAKWVCAVCHVSKENHP